VYADIAAALHTHAFERATDHEYLLPKYAHPYISTAQIAAEGLSLMQAMTDSAKMGRTSLVGHWS
jgi:hypothetical protein